MELFTVVLKALLLTTSVTGVCGQCSVPSFLEGSWWDSDKGLIQFGQTDLTGWETQHSAGQVIADWDCYFENQTTADDTYLILRSQAVYTALQLKAYLCLELTKISDYSYVYYLASAENLDLQYERITQVNDSQTIIDATAELCVANGDTDYPDSREYHVIVKYGHENDVPQDCHYPLGSGVRYHYSITDTQNNVTYCNTSMERWDVCNTTMTFDYSICPYKIAYSDSGRVYCVYSQGTGFSFSQMVFSKDETTGKLIFACFVVRKTSYDNFRMSLSPNSCRKGQLAGNQPTLPNSTVVGVNLQVIEDTSNSTVNCDSSVKSDGATTSYSRAAFGVLVASMIFQTLYTRLVGLFLLC